MNRRFRLIAALGMAVTLMTFMAYIAIKGGDVQEPLLQAQELVSKRELASSQVVQVDGLAAGPMDGEQGKRFSFYVTDRDGKHKTLVDYKGSVPDAFRVGRNVIVTGTLVADPKTGDHVFKAKPGTLVTKCPSKFQSDGGTSRSDS
ncbi:MAG: cytochrome c maturation protein CcmE [Thermoleophilia bacterium]|nr:cytochrome c maturation protein CcmE [Thermoleophilia bacterium]